MLSYVVDSSDFDKLVPTPGAGFDPQIAKQIAIAHEGKMRVASDADKTSF